MCEHCFRIESAVQKVIALLFQVIARIALHIMQKTSRSLINILHYQLYIDVKVLHLHPTSKNRNRGEFYSSL